MTAHDESVLSERALQGSEVCSASLEAAQPLVDELLGAMGDPDSVLYRVIAQRAAGMSADTRLGLSPALLVDPSKSGIVVARYRLQEGVLPADAASTDPDQAVTLWAAQDRGSIAPLKVPEGFGESLMQLADALQMRGGGPAIFSREEVSHVPIGPRTLLNVIGGAKNAPRERLMSALAIVEAHPDYGRPIIATVNPMRILKPDERAAIAWFAPEATNEQELFIDSAIAMGFEEVQSRYGARVLPDGSAYRTMQHENGTEMIILAPAITHGATGVFNAYKSLMDHGAVLLGDGFQFEGSDIVHITSTHYGTMAVMNSLQAVDDLRTSVGSFHVIGDNQPARTPQAHLIEIGLTLDAVAQLLERPALRSKLLPVAA